MLFLRGWAFICFGGLATCIWLYLSRNSDVFLGGIFANVFFLLIWIGNEIRYSNRRM